MSNLRLINETTVTSGVTTVNVTDVFSADFDIYKVVLENFNVQTANDYFYMKLLNSAGSVVTTSTYDSAALTMYANTTFAEAKATNNPAGLWTTTNFLNTTQAEAYESVNYVFNPYSTSSYTFTLCQHGQHYSTNFRATKGTGVEKTLQSITGMQFVVGILGGTLANGTIRTYGLRVDS